MALFHFDALAGNHVGVLWRPTAFLPRAVHVNELMWSCPLLDRVSADKSKGETPSTPGTPSTPKQIVPNIVEVLSRMAELGEGLVSEVHLEKFG